MKLKQVHPRVSLPPFPRPLIVWRELFSSHPRRCPADASSAKNAWLMAARRKDTLPPIKIEPDRRVLEDHVPFNGTPCQVPC